MCENSDLWVGLVDQLLKGKAASEKETGVFFENYFLDNKLDLGFGKKEIRLLSSAGLKKWK